MTNWPYNLATFSFGLFSLFTTRTVPCKLYFQQLRHCSLSDTVYRSSARCIDCRSGWIGLASLSYHHRAFGGLLELLLVISLAMLVCIIYRLNTCLDFALLACKLCVLTLLESMCLRCFRSYSSSLTRYTRPGADRVSEHFVNRLAFLRNSKFAIQPKTRTCDTSSSPSIRQDAGKKSASVEQAEEG